MLDTEIKDRIQQLLTRGYRRISGPARPNLGHLDTCTTRFHRCVACGGDKPDWEFGSSKSKFCLHFRCDQLWTEVERTFRR